jgi:hypothetical protein
VLLVRHPLSVSVKIMDQHLVVVQWDEEVVVAEAVVHLTAVEVVAEAVVVVIVVEIKTI